MQQGNHYMAHKCGFTYSALVVAFLQAGFKNVVGGRRIAGFDLWLAASKDKKSEAEMKEIASKFLP